LIFVGIRPLVNKTERNTLIISHRHNSSDADGAKKDLENDESSASFPSALLVSGRYASLQFRTFSPEISAGMVPVAFSHVCSFE
jgi:hypothetical protein